ncbi:MAG: DNA polymerase III subunit beta [Planctomycetota bacterium]
MKVLCDRTELAASVGELLAIVPGTQTTKAILQCFHLKAGADGGLLIEATDLEIGARVWIERVQVLEAGEAAVPAGRFSPLLREIADKDVTLEALPGGAGAVLLASGCEFRLLGQDPSEFPEIPEFRLERSFSLSREALADSVRRVGIAASREIARYQFTGVHFEVEGDKLTLTATDGRRLTNEVLGIDNAGKTRASAIVPNRAVDLLARVLGQASATARIAIQDPDFQVSFGRGDLTAKLLQGAYPDCRSVLQVKVASRVTANRQALLAAARSAALMTTRETASVGFRFEADKVCLSTQVTDVGESRIEVPIVLEGAPMELRFNPVYFIDALRCLDDEEVQIELAAPEKPVVVRSAQTYRHLVMPLVTD